MLRTGRKDAEPSVRCQESGRKLRFGNGNRGMIVRSKIYIVAGLTCMALSVLFPLYDYFLKKIATSDGIEITAGLLNNEILIFAGVFFIMMVVPGHIINYQSHKRCSRN